jgi:hypothetical protein
MPSLALPETGEGIFDPGLVELGSVEASESTQMGSIFAFLGKLVLWYSEKQISPKISLKRNPPALCLATLSRGKLKKEETLGGCNSPAYYSEQFLYVLPAYTHPEICLSAIR